MSVVLSNSLISATDLQLRFISGCFLKPSRQQSLLNVGSRNLSLHPIRERRLDGNTACKTGLSVGSRNLSLHPIHERRLDGNTACKTGLSVRAGFSESGRTGSTSIFIGAFVLGGIIVGTLGCFYAPQISRALAGTDKKDLMRKLPKFIYDEEKALEKTREILTKKIAQLNSAIDDVSSQLRADDGPNGAAVASDEVEAAL